MATAAISFAAPTFLRRTLRALTVPQVASFNSHPIFHSHSLPLTISPSFYSGICHVVHAFKGDANDVLLKGVADKNTVEAVKHILEMVCWEKFARYFEVELKEVKLREGYYVMDLVKAAEMVDENTICVAAILGSTLTGEFEADLPEEFIFHINYLGADQPTFTLNFLKGSSQIIAQYYQFIRLGYKGYKNIMENCMENANVLKESLEKMGRFEIQAGYQPRLLTLQPLWMK